MDRPRHERAIGPEPLHAHLAVSTTQNAHRVSTAVVAVSMESISMRLSPEAIVRELRRVYRQLPPATLAVHEHRRHIAFNRFIEECVVAFVNSRDADQVRAERPFDFPPVATRRTSAPAP